MSTLPASYKPWNGEPKNSARRQHGPVDTICDGIEIAWKGGTRSCYPNKACADMAIANTDGTRVSFSHGIRFDLPTSVELSCSLCGLPWSDHRRDD